ncbi:MAG: DUF167 domain-containing protein [bacterium]
MPTPPPWIVATTDGCILTIKATPRASRTEIARAEAAWLRIRLQAPPVDGRANEALTEFLSGQLDLPRRAITVVAGETSRIKKVRVAGLGVAGVRAKLGV